MFYGLGAFLFTPGIIHTHIQISFGVVRLFFQNQPEMLYRFAPLPVVQAQLLGLLSTPATRIAGALSGSLRQVASLFSAYSESEAAGST